MQDEDQRSVFMTWLGEHGSSVMKVARAYTLTNDECQDLAQEILLEAWRSLPNFQGKASPATWFYRVALHTAMNWHRKDKPRRISLPTYPFVRERYWLPEAEPLDSRALSPAASSTNGRPPTLEPVSERPGWVSFTEDWVAAPLEIENESWLDRIRGFHVPARRHVG